MFVRSLPGNIAEAPKPPIPPPTAVVVPAMSFSRRSPGVITPCITPNAASIPKLATKSCNKLLSSDIRIVLRKAGNTLDPM